MIDIYIYIYIDRHWKWRNSFILSECIKSDSDDCAVQCTATGLTFFFPVKVPDWLLDWPALGSLLLYFLLEVEINFLLCCVRINQQIQEKKGK